MRNISPFATPGVHELCVFGSDAASNVGAPACILLAVFDPNGGFVTGGGWITSPAGAYAANTSVSGKAHVGFVSKYQQGANVPTGETEFTAPAVNFHSTTYEWLVVFEGRAQLKGTGTLNGVEGYGFVLTAIDGDLPGGTGADRFRMKIFDSATNSVVYDNQPGESDASSAATNLGGGNVIIHQQ